MYVRPISLSDSSFWTPTDRGSSSALGVAVRSSSKISMSQAFIAHFVKSLASFFDIKPWGARSPEDASYFV